MLFKKGAEYRRRDLHAVYKGQEQGGISTPADYPFIMLFDSDTGENYGYTDRWTPGGLFHYTGEGQLGDQQFVRGNRQIRDHVELGKELHLFEYTRPGFVQYVGEFVYVGHHTRQAPDVRGNLREVIVFELKPVEA